ncbi:hypothetical protein F4774DRAFT_410121 [Daldinia eschscholtzii]|nr:hypothetical protein F4774DRAFT_410121 [Daldinia eschscholtzii]
MEYVRLENDAPSMVIDDLSAKIKFAHSGLGPNDQVTSLLFEIAQGEAILDYGFLQFTAQTAKLWLKQKVKQTDVGSENGNKWVKAKCPTNGTHNIMLIEWDGDIAYRKGLGMIEEEVWATVKTKSKRIVLG